MPMPMPMPMPYPHSCWGPSRSLSSRLPHFVRPFRRPKWEERWKNSPTWAPFCPGTCPDQEQTNKQEGRARLPLSDTEPVEQGQWQFAVAVAVAVQWQPLLGLSALDRQHSIGTVAHTAWARSPGPWGDEEWSRASGCFDPDGREATWMENRSEQEQRNNRGRGQGQELMLHSSASPSHLSMGMGMGIIAAPRLESAISYESGILVVWYELWVP